MKGDFSRDTFNQKKNFRRVLMQQGRVQLDADWNEQSSILLHYIQTLAADLIGPHAGPENGFAIEFNEQKNDLIIKKGRYYVDGILCENENDVGYLNQPYLRDSNQQKTFPPKVPFLVYLDVWERHVTSLEDEHLREVALGGIDTTTRSQVVWQVKIRELSSDGAHDCENVMPIDRGIEFLPNAPLLIADVPSSEDSGDPCNIAPDSRYRGMENQLYRVEVHRGNTDDWGEVDDKVTPTFKWSRENGAVVFPVIGITVSGGTTKVRLAHLGRDGNFTLREGDWVEIADDYYTLGNRSANLLKVSVIDRDEMSVTLTGTTDITAEAKSKNHALLRRWDQKPNNSNDRDLTLADDNAAVIVEGNGDNNWLEIEDGIRIQFFKNTSVDMTRNPPKSAYRTGDYWLIPARTATGDIEWLQNEDGTPRPQQKNGIEHHYAPLVIINADKSLKQPPCRRTLNPIFAGPAAIAGSPKLKETTKKDKNS